MGPGTCAPVGFGGQGTPDGEDFIRMAPLGAIAPRASRVWPLMVDRLGGVAGNSCPHVVRPRLAVFEKRSQCIKARLLLYVSLLLW